ncbi:error-prone DNA polymerase [Sphingobium boeckii]|uniref:Error-prone DNA polymerase n=1 Tax=Sphingobium boeckii TaxID=1082345 RepID=A0A7W9AJT9_9SPHN|nr:error-prone DNA polymerase [Sphingobium boeckii]MBB5686791.1 error-prone DNA polymerase [Sphingobium boeckii]
MSDAPLPAFAELVAATNYSFLRGASTPQEMVLHANHLGMAAIGIADRNTVAGVVRAWVAHRDGEDILRQMRLEEKKELGQKEQLTATEAALCKINVRLVVGARLVFADGTPDIIAYPATRCGWGRLTRLLSLGNLRSEKGGCILRFDDLLGYLEDLLLIVMPYASPIEIVPRKKMVEYDYGEETLPKLSLVMPPLPERLAVILERLARRMPGRVWLGASMGRRGDDARQLARLKRMAGAAGVPLIATNDVLYALPDQRPLHDVLTCIREGTTILEAGQRLEANAERYLKGPEAMARLFADCPEAMAETVTLISKIDFTLDDLQYEYPHEPVPEGWTPQDWLEHLVMEGARKRYGETLSPAVLAQIEEEFLLVKQEKYAYYFLTVHDVVRFARGEGILCQGRGSAANSIICYALGITSVDPIAHKLLFTRFLSEDRKEPPDIDVDFEHERREEVMQYIYKRYGRHRAGIAATVIHYRPRSAVREVGKVFGMSEDVTARLSGTVWGSFSNEMKEQRYEEAGFSLENEEMKRLSALVGQILKFPRHLSQHVGGYVLTQDRLDETVPIHNAAMNDRTFIEWDKDDIDALKLMKVDILALGMLTCIGKAFDMLRTTGGGDYELHTIPAEDAQVYKMLQKGDSLGVFQVESRAQINMLPRLRPAKLYDLVIQVAIVRPGPIEGDMVHPYLRRRNGEEKVDYPSPSPAFGPPDELFQLLGNTLGVPLFQEQAMKLAITAAGFSPPEANQLRRAMATFRNVGTIGRFERMMVDGMTRRGYKKDFAARCYKQIQGFGSYGFPESHAQSFAILVYVSSWLKHYHPAIFCCALLNSQPMGFYAPAQLVGDAKDHGVEIRAIDVNHSNWDNSVERREDGTLALRLGLRQIDGFSKPWAETIAAARGAGPFVSVEDLARRAHLPSRALRLLADADACRSFGMDRRTALWDVRRTPNDVLPLFAAADARELAVEPDAALPIMAASEQVAADYQTHRLSLKGHPMQFLRESFRSEGVLSCAETSAAKNGARVRTAGVVLVRQRPGKGNAIFITIEDETGVTNILLWARQFERNRRPVMASRLMLVEGEVQRSKEGVVHLMASRIVDRTAELQRLSEDHQTRPEILRADVVLHPQAPRHTHPRDARILPKSRDFH